MRFYIASSFANKANVRYVSTALQEAGFVHTYDWTENERAVDVSTLKKIGRIEKQAVADSELFIMMLPAGKGSHIELGMAIALHKQIFIYAADEITPAHASTFYYIDGVTHVNGEIDDFIENIKNLKRKRI